MTSDISDRLFKKLTPENWLECDPTINYWVRISDDGQQPAISNDEWVGKFLFYSLSEAIPAEVHRLFEVAQGTICYGCFFYPLLTFGTEQLFRVMEAAASHKCIDLEAPNKIKTFKNKLDWLRKKDVLSENRLKQWDAARTLRNSSSHADRQSLFGPNAALDNLEVTVELINELFDQ